MCGLAGVFVRRGRDPEALRGRVGAMTASIRHRGPDDDGIWLDSDTGVALGFRRLAILDLSPAGHQPMASRSGRYTIVFNGAIYNYRELRRQLELESREVRGQSDTSVIVAGLEAWGLIGTVERLTGMFAIACWDRERRALSLIRDRLGIKPLYYGDFDDGIMFGSELRALETVPDWPRRLRQSALSAYLSHLYVPDPVSIYEGVSKVPPGTIVEFTDPGISPPTICRFWTLDGAAARGRADPFTGTLGEAADELEAILGVVLDEHLCADVPLGAYLSGGIDSSLVAALTQRLLGRPLQTYCVGFDDPQHDESPHAAAVARHLGTEHHSLPCTGSDALAAVPAALAAFDEPFADASQVPALLLNRAARSGITVALSGEGGDELFGGYNRYVYGARVLEWVAQVPAWMRKPAGALLGAIDSDSWAGAPADVMGRLHPGLSRLVGQRMARLGAALRAPRVPEAYRALLAAWEEPRQFLPSRNASAMHDPVVDAMEAYADMPLAERLLMVDQATYLLGDQLTKADRTSMAASLELRVPLLDHRVLEFSWRLPVRYRYNRTTSKRVLRELLYRHVPREIVERPKVGFSVPLQQWLRGPLREWAGDLLLGETLGVEGFLNRDAVGRAWRQFQEGQGNLALGIWTLCALESWRVARRLEA
jgi:asparagine synthase (glutamine-hydrolysing)